MTPQIVYVLVANEKNLYLEEMWVSLYSLRLQSNAPNSGGSYHVVVLVDEDTEKMVKARPELLKLIDELIVVPTPEGYNAKQRSRQIKTTVREVVKGDYLFIDTDTVICKPLDSIASNLAPQTYIAAVPDGHQPLKDYPYSQTVYGKLKRIWGIDATDCEYWYNSGVMFVRDTPEAHEFYRQWNEEWIYSCFEKEDSQDQPALLKVNREKGFVIQNLPDIYNAQIGMSMKYFADAAIVHWWHMSFIPDQSYSPFLSLQIYKDLKNANCITPEIADQIINCKSSWNISTIPVGIDQMLFLFSETGKNFVQIYKEGGAASWLMIKVAKWLNKLHKYTKKSI